MMKLSELARVTQGVLSSNDCVIEHFSIDSRTIRQGDCFIAITGEIFDGHDFIAQAASQHAAAVMVDRDVITSIPVVRVANTRTALIDLARFYRQQASIPITAITGSCGKTTTRALLENILKHKGCVLASQKSFNNDIGLPLTLLQLHAQHDYAVLEIGTNHPGEIAYLASIAQPTIAVVTMVAPVHIEYFGTVETVAHEKGTIFQHLATDSIAVINADDTFAHLWKTMAVPHRVMTFGCAHDADVVATQIATTTEGYTRFVLKVRGQATPITLMLLGAHNVINALAASTAALAMGVSMHDIKTGLETSEPVYGRMIEKKAATGAVIIDDTYNANPASVKAAIRLLAHRSKNGIFVLGDMRELGAAAVTLHREIGEFARAAGLRQLFCYGEHSMHAAIAFGKAGQHFESQQALIDSLKLRVTADVTVLIKGSRSMKMEIVVNALV